MEGVHSRRRYLGGKGEPRKCEEVSGRV